MHAVARISRVDRGSAASIADQPRARVAPSMLVTRRKPVPGQMRFPRRTVVARVPSCVRVAFPFLLAFPFSYTTCIRRRSMRQRGGDRRAARAARSHL